MKPILEKFRVIHSLQRQFVYCCFDIGRGLSKFEKAKGGLIFKPVYFSDVLCRSNINIFDKILIFFRHLGIKLAGNQFCVEVKT